MAFLTLTCPRSGAEILVNTDHIVSVIPTGLGGTILETTDGRCHRYTEHPQAVANWLTNATGRSPLPSNKS